MSSNQRLLDIRWPMAGLDERPAYRQQRPFTTFDAQNVRPDGQIKGRERGGSRPGLIKAYQEQLGSGNPIRLLEQCTVIRTDSYTYWTDDFKGSALSSVWTVASWIGAAPGVTDDLASVSSATGETGVTRDAITNIDTSKAYQLEMLIVPFEGSHHGKYQFFLRMGAGLDATADGVIVELIMEDGTGDLSGTVKSYTGGVLTDNWSFTDPAIDSTAEPGWFKVHVSTNSITVFWRGSTILATQTLTEGAAGSRVGFGINCTQAGGTCLVENVRIQYADTDAEFLARRTHLIASSNGILYRDKDDFRGEMEAVSSNLTLASDRSLLGADAGGKLYIADHGTPLKTGTDGKQGTGTTKFDDAAGTDWSALGISIYDHVLVVSDSTGGMIDGVYAIASLTSSEITTTVDCNSGAGTCTYRIERGVKYFDPATDTFAALMATSGKGQIPIGCPLIATYRDRLVLAGHPDDPHVWYMSRQGDYNDWYTLDSDSQRSINAGNADAGKIGEPILALITHSDDFLIFGCTNSLWVLAGDPAIGGELNNISRVIGVVSASAWCRTPEGGIVILSRDGLYMIGPSEQIKPISLSREVMPTRLRNFDPDLHEISLEYDVEDRGVHIFITPKLGGANTTHYWFDWELKGFWPVVVASTSEPMVVKRFVSEAATDTGVILGCRDGYLRKFYGRAETDDGTTISSYVNIGPIAIGGGDYFEGILDEIVGVTAENGGDVDWELYVGKTAEAAATSTTLRSSGSWNTAGLNYKSRPMARAKAIVLKLKNGETTRAWALERITARAHTAGKAKKL